MIRATTNGVLAGYRSHLMNSFVTQNKARNTVLTGRNFLSYAEDPAGAAKSFALRRSFSKVSSQLTVNTNTSRKFDVAWSALDSVSKLVATETTNNSAWKDIMAGLNGATGSGRAPLGESLKQLADNITQSMNGRYGDDYVFAGADGKNTPFTWVNTANGRKLHYRGVPVDATDPSPDFDKLKQFAEEGRFVDIGLGLKEDPQGNLIESSAFNDALQGINYLGYGVDKDGDPKNIVSLINRMGEILSNCDDDGNWGNPGDRAELERLAGKFKDATANFTESYVKMDTQAEFLKNNETQLKTTAAMLNEQIVGLENCDPAEAISTFAWAQYSYNVALKVGNSILSQSLMDYIK